MVIEPRVVQFWSEIVLVISNRTRAVRSFSFEITLMISAQIALHSVQLPLSIILSSLVVIALMRWYLLTIFSLYCYQYRLWRNRKL